MRHFTHFLFYFVGILIELLLCGCNHVSDADHVINVDDSTHAVDIVNWDVVGPFTLTCDSAHKDAIFTRSNKSACNPDSTIKVWHDGLYCPKYGQLDLREVYGININDTTKMLDTLITYLSSTLVSDKDRKMFIYEKTEMYSEIMLNGAQLSKIDLKGMSIYPVPLRKGENRLVIRLRGGGRKYWYEATLHDNGSIAEIYAEEHTGNIVFPIISNDSVCLTDTHCKILDKPIKLMFHDVNGKKVAERTISKDMPVKFHLKGFETDRAYICSMIMGGDTVKQPVMTGTFENIESKYKSLRDSLPDNHPRADEIDQLLYRIWKLNMITGKMREEHWFPFKWPWVVYQLEHIFAHLDGTYGNDENEYNFKYITYRSRLDGCLQRYILVTPNLVDKNTKYPLVVIMRPCNEKRYHLFFSPQIAHQFVVNDMQAVANKYNTFVIMPEARMMLDEDMMPFADAEMKLALEDVQEHYNIDESRIFLHANCSGGYRALRFATYNPDMFAAIALYAPVYKRGDNDKYSPCSPETMLKNIKGIPTLIFGDPADTHSPISAYADLVKDCEKYGVPYELKLHRNSGQGYHGYHRLVVGRDACDFFKDKRKNSSPRSRCSIPPRDTTVADFYTKPFIYIYNVADTSSVYKKLVDDIRNEYEEYLYARLPLDKQTIVPRMPLVPCTRVTRKMLAEKNIFLIGNRFTCQHVNGFAEEIEKKVNKGITGKSDIILSCVKNPANRDGMVLLYKSSKGKLFKHSINYPWRNGFRRTLTAKFCSENEEKNH